MNTRRSLGYDIAPENKVQKLARQHPVEARWSRSVYFLLGCCIVKISCTCHKVRQDTKLNGQEESFGVGIILNFSTRLPQLPDR